MQSQKSEPHSCVRYCALVWRRMGDVITRANLRNQVAIVFQHVQMVIVDQLRLTSCGGSNRELGNAEIDRSGPLNSSGFQLGADRDHPNRGTLGSRTLSGAGCGVERSLGPIHPDAEAAGLACAPRPQTAARP